MTINPDEPLAEPQVIPSLDPEPGIVPDPAAPDTPDAAPAAAPF